MARRILIAEDIAALAPGGEIVLPGNAILTERARELADQRGLRIRLEPSPESTADGGRASEKKKGLVALGADHAGYELKQYLKQFLLESGYEVEDLGTDSTAPVDYPDFARAVAQAVAAGTAWRGIMVDGAGIGSAMTANKVPGIRAAPCYDRATARNSREHNDANLLTLGARLLRFEEAREVAAVWLTTEFAGGRHQSRVDKIKALEQARTGSTPAVPGSGAVPQVWLQDERDRETLIEAITQEILCYLGDKQLCELRGLEIDELVCPGCDVRCVESCPEKARRVMAAGAERLTAGEGVSRLPADIASLIDHTLLRPEASQAEIEKLCDEARVFGFATVCVNPSWVAVAAVALRGTAVKVCTVAGFPLGATLTRTKIFETEQVVRMGAQEVDMVINVGALKSGQHARVEQDIRGVAEASHQGGAICKVILECALLTDQEKVTACCLAQCAGADFVKTSTGFGPGGATAHDVELMRLVVGPQMGVKAAGGIRSYQDLQKMISAGATRIGASASVKILKEAAGADPSSSPAAVPALYERRTD